MTERIRRDPIGPEPDPDLPGGVLRPRSSDPPHMSFQLEPCLPTILANAAAIVGADVEELPDADQIRDGLRLRFEKLMRRQVDFRTVCGTPSQPRRQVETWALWLDSGDDHARLAELGELAEAADLRDGGPLNIPFTHRIATHLIQQLVGRSFRARPHRLNLKGEADPDGLIELIAMSAHFHAPDQLITLVRGAVHGPFGDVAFLMTFTDTFTNSLRVTSSRKLEFAADDVRLQIVLAGLFAAAMAAIPTVVTQIAAVVFVDVVGNLLIALRDPDRLVPDDKTLGESLAAAFLAERDLGPAVLTTEYSAVVIDSTGFVAQGRWNLERPPADDG